MEKHENLNKLVCKTLKFYEDKGINPTAKEVYSEIRDESPKTVNKGFKSFVKVMNSFPEVQQVKKIDGGINTYKRIK